MRITNNMMISNMLRYLGNNQERLSKYQNQLDSGNKISVPSDDPVVAARALKLRTDVSKVEQYQKNIGDARSWLDTTDEALSKLGDVLHKARELMVQASNGTNTEAETQKIGLELKQLRTQAIHLANSSYAGRYIFSGFKTDQKVMNDDENSPNFGNFSLNVDSVNEKIFYELGVGDSLHINVAGGDLFDMGGNASNPGTGVSTARIGKITYPLTLDAADTAVNITVDGANIAVNIPVGPYADDTTLAAAIQDAINASPAMPNRPDSPVPVPEGVTVSIKYNQIVIKTESTAETSQVEIDTVPALSSFFQSINVNEDSIVNTTGATGETPSMIKMFNDVIACMDAGDHEQISTLLDSIDAEMGNVLRCRADVGARRNRVDLTDDRTSNDLVNFTDLMSKNEDVDVAETIMNLKNEENVYQASLAGGARIIQQTLVDFLR